MDCEAWLEAVTRRLLLWLPAFLLLLQLGLWAMVGLGIGLRLPELPMWAWRVWQGLLWLPMMGGL